MIERRGLLPHPPQTHGTCGLCGAHNRDLYMIAAGDYIGWACGECRRQLRDSFIRQFCGTVEHTEPGE
jgi:hypothetical protein